MLCLDSRRSARFLKSLLELDAGKNSRSALIEVRVSWIGLSMSLQARCTQGYLEYNPLASYAKDELEEQQSQDAAEVRNRVPLCRSSTRLVGILSLTTNLDSVRGATAATKTVRRKSLDIVDRHLGNHRIRAVHVRHVVPASWTLSG